MNETEMGKVQKALTLQQKFVKLREAVPAIVQKKHSDGVKYKFAKIFDVYELLTPAMNAYGVNFDIIAERASIHDERGNAIYYHNYIQSTRNGDRLVWVYEADLILQWTNADDPDDTLEVTLHALGTNDGGPDKAKGSAWTYCLKYYFFEKFGIDQGEDDPDNNDYSDGGYIQRQQQNRSTEPQNSAKGKSTRTNQNGRTGAPRLLSDAQLDRMYKKGELAGCTQKQIDDRILQKYGQQDPHNLTREQYEEICNALDAAVEAKKENIKNEIKEMGGNPDA